MKKLTKRLLSAMLSMLMIIGAMGTVAFASETTKDVFTYGENDLVIADFSKAGTREDITYWRGEDTYKELKGTHFRDMTEITDEVSLTGETSFKMDHRYYKTTNGVADYYNSRLQRNFGLITDPLAEYPEDKQTKIFYTVEDVLSYDYLYMWIYSGSANNQTVNVQINDLATSMYPSNIQLKMDYTGWKLHKINISSWELSSFNNTREGEKATAALTDNIRFNMQNSGWSVSEQADTVMYVDSIWLSNNAETYKTDYDEEDYLIGDFTAQGGAAKFGGNIMKDCKEVTRDGRETAVRVSRADGTNGRLQAPEAYKLGEILDKDNLYMWVYSSVANNQLMYAVLFDKTTGGYLKSNVMCNWVGWKRVKIEKNRWNNSYELESFNKNGNVATNDDVAYLWISTTWDQAPYLEDTKLYFDSIWFSDKNLKDGETFTAPANEWETDGGYLVEDFSSENTNVAKWASFKYPHKDKITSDITRLGKSQSLKWTEMGDGTNKINSKLESPKIQNLGDVLKYDYIYLWIYSEKANNQELNVVLTDATANYNGLATKVKMDYVGWKLHKVDISNLTLAKFDDPGTDDKALAKPAPADTDEWKLLLQCSGWSVKPLADTTLYMDTIWLSNVDYYSENAELIKDFNTPAEKITGTFNTISGFKKHKTISGFKKHKTVSSVDTYLRNSYSAEVIPSEDNYTFATTHLYDDSTGIKLDNETLKDKYLNIIINAVNAETQKIRINFDGKMADGSTTMRVYKILNGIEPGWQILSLPLADFTKQNGGNSTEEILNGAGVLNSVDLHFPDWGNGRENVTYREITEGETGTHIYNEETKKYEAVSDGTGTHVIANTYHNGSTHWDNIASKISSDAKYYVDSVFLSDKDMSGDITFKVLNTITEEVALDGFKAVFEAPYILSWGIDTYKNDITVTKNGTAVSSDEYVVNTDEKRLIVTFKNELDYNSDYEIKVSKGLTMANGLETTDDCVLNISSLTKYSSFAYPMDITNSGKITFTAATALENISASVEATPDNFVSLSASTVINNTTSADTNVSILLAVYNSNNQLVGMFKGNDVTIAAGAFGTVTANVTGEFADCTAKAFLWDMSANAMIPYTAATPLN